jgi:hypothetical protein
MWETFLESFIRKETKLNKTSRLGANRIVMPTDQTAEGP